MTLSEVYSNFLRDFGREFTKQNTDPPRLEIKDVAADIAEAQQDIQRRLKVVEKNRTISISAGTNTAQLPSDFGNQKLVTLNNLPLLEKTSQELSSLDDSSGEPTAYAILVSGRTQYLFLFPTPSETLNVVLHYYPDFNYYSASSISSQNWGTFDGDVLSGYLMFPDRYIKAVTLYMLAKWFDKFEMKYEVELKRLKSGRVVSMSPSFGYNLGLDGQSKNINGGTVATIIQQEYTKSYKFTMIEGEDPIFVSSTGFAGTITLSKDGTTIVITSANNEFLQPSTFIKTEPSDLNYIIEANEIRISTYSGHDPISGEIKVW